MSNIVNLFWRSSDRDYLAKNTTSVGGKNRKIQWTPNMQIHPVMCLITKHLRKRHFWLSGYMHEMQVT